MTFFLASREGREIQIWPPKIGKREVSNNSSKSKLENKKPDIDFLNNSKAYPVLHTLAKLQSQNSFADIIKDTNELLLAGVALSSAAKRYQPQLLERVKDGAKLQLLMLDPLSSDVELMAKSFKLSPVKLRDDIASTLDDLDILRKQANKNNPNSIEIRLLSHEPAISFALSNPRSKEGYFSIGIRAYGLRSTTRPYVVLRPNSEWYTPLRNKL